MAKTDQGWTPPTSLGERLKGTLVPGGVDIRRRVRRELAKGEPELGLVPYLCRRGSISLDVGANRGVYAWCMAQACDHVHAFEPNPKMLRVLKRVLPKNGTAHGVALSSEDGMAEFSVPMLRKGYSNQGGTLRPREGLDHGTMPVAVRRLDTFQFRDVGFIKIDVEGAELSVLEGGRETIARERPNLLVEIEQKHLGGPVEDALAAVEAMGYRGFFLRRGQLTPLAAFDADANHRKAASRADYVFNFIFLPG